MVNQRKDFFCGITFVAFSVISLFCVERYIPKSSSQISPVGPDGFPRMIVLIMLVLSLFLLAINFVKIKKTKVGFFDKNSFLVKMSGVELSAMLLTALLIGYSMAIGELGFLMATLIFTTLLLLLMKIKIWWWYGVCYGFTFMVHLIFTLVLKVALP